MMCACVSLGRVRGSCHRCCAGPPPAQLLRRAKFLQSSLKASLTMPSASCGPLPPLLPSREPAECLSGGAQGGCGGIGNGELPVVGNHSRVADVKVPRAPVVGQRPSHRDCRYARDGHSLDHQTVGRECGSPLRSWAKTRPSEWITDSGLTHTHETALSELIFPPNAAKEGHLREYRKPRTYQRA